MDTQNANAMWSMQWNVCAMVLPQIKCNIVTVYPRFRNIEQHRGAIGRKLQHDGYYRIFAPAYTSRRASHVSEVPRRVVRGACTKPVNKVWLTRSMGGRGSVM